MGEKSKNRGHYSLKMRALALMLSLMMVLTTSGFQAFAEEVGASAQQTSADQAAKDKAEAEAAAAKRAAEEEARRAAEAAAAEAAAKAAAEEAARKAAEEKAAAEKAAAESEAAAKAAAESEAAAKAAAEKEAAEKAAAEQAAAEKAAAEQAAAQKAAEESEAAAKAAAEKEAAEKAADTEKAAEADKKDKDKKKENNKEQEKTVTYRVSFDTRAAEHGTIRVEDKEAAVSTYYKEVKANSKFTFTVTAAEGWKVDTVKIDDNNVPKTARENEYEIAAVNKDTVIKVAYQELPKESEAAEEKAEETETAGSTETEEGKTETDETEAGKGETEDQAEETNEEAAEDTAVKNVVTFEAGVGVTILCDGADVTNGTGNAKDGKILFTVVPTEGYAVTSVLVDGTKEARTTGNAGEYVIEGIKTDDTMVSVNAEWVGVETETETETEALAELETEWESESETEVSMPAFFHEEMVDGVRVKINAPEGAFPEGTTVTVIPASASQVEDVLNEQAAQADQEVVDYVAFDITFFDKEGKEIEPTENVQVTFSGLDMAEGDTANVIHIKDDGNAEVLKEDLNPEAGQVGFTVDSFSVMVYSVNNKLDARASGTQRVYLYVHVKGDTTGLTLNGNGWYTVGYIDVTGIPAASEVLKGGPVNDNVKYTYGENYEQAVIAAVKAGNYTAYSMNARVITRKFVTNVIDWEHGYINQTKINAGLCIANGATDYVSAGTYTWHLDGLLEIPFKYLIQDWIENEDGTYAPYGATRFEVFNELSSDKKVFGTDAKIDIPGYTYDHAEGDSGKDYIVLNDKNKTLNLYYKRPKVTVSGKKVWNDDNNAAGLRPEKITVELLADGKNTGKTVQPDSGNWEWEFENLPQYKYSGNGEKENEISYTFKEHSIDGYDSTYSVIENGKITITNTLKAKDVTIYKQWQQTDGTYANTAAYGAAASFGLYTDQNCATSYQKNDKPVTAAVVNGQAIFKDLPYGTYYVKELALGDNSAYANNGAVVKLTVGETVRAELVSGTEGAAVAGNKVTFKNDLKMVDLTIKKAVNWKGTKPESVDFAGISYSYADGTSTKTGMVTAKVNVDGNGTETISYLNNGKKVNTDGVTISVRYGTTVTVNESAPGWTASWSENVTSVQGSEDSVGGTVTVTANTDVTVTNTRILYKGDGSLTAEKTWKIDGATPDVIPSKVTLVLYKGETEVKVIERKELAVTVSEEGNTVTATTQQAVFEKLPMYEPNGALISYSVAELAADGTKIENGGSVVFTEGTKSSQYKVTYDQENYQVTNTYQTPDAASLTLKAHKILNGRNLTAGAFEFVVEQGENNPQKFTFDPITNDAQGDVSISLANIIATGHYEFTVKEKAGKDTAKIAYDDHEYPVSFDVTRDDNNNLKAAILTVDGQSKEVAADKPVEIGNFTNTSKTGNLNLTKVLQDSVSGGSFTFVVTAPSEVKLGEKVQLARGEKEEEVSVTTKDSGVQTFEIPITVEKNSQQTVTVKNLPVGNYTVTEKGETNGKLTTESGVSYTVSYETNSEVTAAMDGTATITNTRTEKGTLTFTKTWVDADGTALKEALIPESLVVELKRNNETINKKTTLQKNEFTGNKWTWKVSDLEMFDENGTAYNYSVEETLNKDNYSVVGEALTAVATPDYTNKTYTAALSNTRNYGAENGLTITKSINAGNGTVSAEMKQDTFSFTVTGPEDFMGSVEYKVTADGKDKKTGSAEIKNNSFTVSEIYDGETVTVITPLPTGSYSVTETQEKGNQFTYDASVRLSDSEDGTGTLAKDGSLAFTAVNTLKKYKGDITVTKLWQMQNGAYVATGYSDIENGTAVATFGLYTDANCKEAYTVNGNAQTANTGEPDGAVFSNLPCGTYYLKEISITGTNAYNVSNKVVCLVVGENDVQKSVVGDGSEAGEPLTFKNELKTATLTLVKVVNTNGVKLDDDAEFIIDFSYTNLGEQVNGSVKAAVTAEYDENDQEMLTYSYTGTNTEDGGNTITVPYGAVVTVSEGLAGWTTQWSDSVKENETAGVTTYQVTVNGDTTATVTNTRDLFNGNGKLVAKKAWSNGDKTPDVIPDSVVLVLTKNTDSNWSMELATPTEGNADDTKKVTFENLPTHEADGREITYTVKEKNASEGGIVYTKADKRSQYAVDEGTAANDYTVTNTYAAPDSIPLSLAAVKELVGRKLNAEDFSFTVTPSGTTPNYTGKLGGKNEANGSISLGTMTISETGDYELTVAETPGDRKDIEYTEDTHVVRFKVIQNEKNVLQIENLTVDGTPVYNEDGTDKEGAFTEDGKLNVGTFTNTTKTGDMTLTKELKDSTAKGDDTFTFTVTAPEDVKLSDPGVSVKVNKAIARISDNSFSVEVKPSKQNGTYQASAVITGLPVGSYLVTENEDANADTTDALKTVNGKNYIVENEGAVEVKTDSDESLTITNIRQESGTLTFTKVWKDWTGKVTTETSLIAATELTATVQQNGEPYENGTLKLNSANEWKATLDSVPLYDAKGIAYEYTITEAVPEGYTANGMGMNSATVTAEPNYENHTLTATITNTRQTGKSEKDGGSLSITKTIQADGDVTTQMEADTFTFTVQGPTDLNGTITYQVESKDKQTATAKNGVFTLLGVHHGETVTVLSALPTGTYAVTGENTVSADGNTFLYAYSMEENEKTLAENGNVNYEAVNTLQQGSISVKKEWQQPNSGEYTDKAYGNENATATFGLYKADGKTPYLEGSVQKTATTDNSGTATFNNVPYGTYVVKELRLNDADAYTVSEDAITVEVSGIIAEDNKELIIQNDLKTTGALMIVKDIQWNETTPEEENFDIGFSYRLPGVETETTGTVRATYKDGEVTYTIQNGGDSAKAGNTITNLPYGTEVTLTETTNGWTPSGAVEVTGEVAADGSVTATGTVTANAETQIATVTNTRDLYNDTGELTARKIWVTEGGPDVQPEEVTIVLYKQVGEGAPEEIERSKTTDGLVTFSDLPKKDLTTDQDIVYSVKEAYPTVDENPGDVVENGQTIVFTKDLKSSEYTVTYGDNYTVTNTYKIPDAATLTLSANKELKGRVLKDGAYHFTVTAEGERITPVNASNDGQGVINFQVITLTKTGDYKLTVREVPDEENLDENVTYATELHHVTFTVERGNLNQLVIKNLKVDDATPPGQTDDSVAQANINVGTFTNVTKTGSLTLTKILKDSTANGSDTFTFTVTALNDVDLTTVKDPIMINGTQANITDNGFTVELTLAQEDGFRADAVISGLPVGTYNVVENGEKGEEENSKVVNGKTYLVSGEGTVKVTVSKGNSNSAALVVTNTRKETANLTFTKQWRDGEGNDLVATHSKMIPGGLTVVLKQNGEAYKDKEGKEVKLNLGKPNWTAEVSGLEVFDENGQEYNYTVTETPLKGFTAATIEAQKQNGTTAEAIWNEKNGTYSVTLTNVKDALDPEDPTKEAGTPTKYHTEGHADQVIVGGEITYTITWTNHLNTNAIVTITDKVPDGTEFVKAEKDGVLKDGIVTWNINAQPFETGSVKLKVRVTEAALEGAVPDPEIENTAYVTIKNGSEVVVNEKPAPADPIPVFNPDWTVKKTLANEGTGENGAFRLGETAEFNIEVVNTGNVELKDLLITETLDGARFKAAEDTSYTLEADGTIAKTTIGIGKNVTLKASYTVQEADLGKTLKNVVTTKLEKPDPDVPGPNLSGEEEIPTEDYNPSIQVVKGLNPESRGTAADGRYALGDTIIYDVVVTNNGNITLTAVKLRDVMTGPDGQSTFAPSGFDPTKIEELAPGESVKITYSHVVTEADLGGVLKNAATATGTPKLPDPDDPDTEPKPVEDTDEEEVPTDDRNPKLEVVKEVTSDAQAADGKYVLGETITYKVTVTNTGNLTVTNIVVSDAMTRPDGTPTIPSGIADIDTNIGTLAPGESKPITYTHVVTEADLGGNLTNAATATGKPEIPDPDPETPDPDPTGKDDETVVTDDPENCTITVTKQTFSGLDEPIILAEGAEFRVALFSDEAMTTQVGEARTIRYDGNSSTAQVTFANLKRGTYYVAEVEASGAVLTAGEYDGGAFVPVYDNGNSVVITENGGSAEFGFNNSFLILPTSYYDAKPVTITKNVKDIHGKAMKSKETFYAGIFTDEAYTTLADTDVVGENIIPLKMNGKSSVSTTIEMKVPQTGENVQLYITEVTSAGKPVGAGFGYDMEVENGSLSLNTETIAETVTITNTSNKEEEETKTSTSTKEQKSSKSTSDSTKAVKTGDETPILPYTGMLGISALYILIFLAKRRRREEA